jgi:dihydroorotase
MEREGIPLLGHWEAVEEEVDEFDREKISVDRDLKPIIKSFPGLPIVFEHITTGDAADFVAEVDHEIYATVTAHHLVINRNAMFKGGMNPCHYCKPVPKREEHRLRVRKYVTSGNKRFGAGTDSAPHDEEAKSCCYGCAAGIFTAPCAVELYSTVFDEDNALGNLGPFLSENFVDLYGMKVSQEMMTLVRQPLEIPKKIGNVQVFKGGTTLPWTLLPDND